VTLFNSSSAGASRLVPRKQIPPVAFTPPSSFFRRSIRCANFLSCPLFVFRPSPLATEHGNCSIALGSPLRQLFPRCNALFDLRFSKRAVESLFHDTIYFREIPGRLDLSSAFGSRVVLPYYVSLDRFFTVLVITSPCPPNPSFFFFFPLEGREDIFLLAASLGFRMLSLILEYLSRTPHRTFFESS